jgi:hypothetical protein
MSDALDAIQTRRLMPRRFRRTVDSYQLNILDPITGQPEGFLKFTGEWKAIINEIASYEESAETHPNMSRRDIRRNIRNMFGALSTLIDSGSYFTHQDLLSSEGINHIVNPNNNTPIGNSETTNWEFGAGYQTPLPTVLVPFNNIVMIFPAVPLFLLD